jgi:Costars
MQPREGTVNSLATVMSSQQRRFAQTVALRFRRSVHLCLRCAYGVTARQLLQRTMNVEHEITLLISELQRLGKPNASGQVSVPFGVLVRDEKCGDLFEALVGTLRAAKKRKVITYDGEMLLQGAHDAVEVVLLKTSYP